MNVATWSRPPVAPIARPATRSIVAIVAGVGVVGDLAARSGPGLAMGMLVAGTSLALLGSRRLATTQARALVLVAPLFGGWVLVRTSVWLVPLDLLAAFALLVFGASLSSGGSLADLPFVALVARGAHALVHGIVAPGFIAPLLRGRGPQGRAVAIVRGAALAVPALAVLGALLASADAVFASFLHVDVDSGEVLLHIGLVTATGWVMLGLLRVASAEPVDLPARGRWKLGGVETTIVLGSVVALFGAFVLAQVLAMFGAADHVLRTEGLTYAEYARSGFFQLLWVCGLTIAGLLLLQALSSDEDRQLRRRFVVLADVVVVLTIGIAAVALRRLALYQDAYGLTMLRLFCSVFAGWLTVVLVLLGASISGVGRPRAWFPAAASLSALAALLALNVVNPEAVVARTNLLRSSRTPADPAYLADLSDDAVPTMVSLLPQLEPTLREQVIGAIGCPGPSDFTGWAAWNLSVEHAGDARRPFCEA